MLVKEKGFINRQSLGSIRTHFMGVCLRSLCELFVDHTDSWYISYNCTTH